MQFRSFKPLLLTGIILLGACQDSTDESSESPATSDPATDGGEATTAPLLSGALAITLPGSLRLADTTSKVECFTLDSSATKVEGTITDGTFEVELTKDSPVSCRVMATSGSSSEQICALVIGDSTKKDAQGKDSTSSVVSINQDVALSSSMSCNQDTGIAAAPLSSFTDKTSPASADVKLSDLNDKSFTMSCLDSDSSIKALCQDKLLWTSKAYVRSFQGTKSGATVDVLAIWRSSYSGGTAQDAFTTCGSKDIGGQMATDLGLTFGSGVSVGTQGTASGMNNGPLWDSSLTAGDKNVCGRRAINDFSGGDNPPQAGTSNALSSAVDNDSKGWPQNLMVLGYAEGGLAGSQTVKRTETITWTLKAGGSCSSQVNHAFSLTKSAAADQDYIGTYTMHTKTDCPNVDDSVMSFKIGLKGS